MKKERAMQRRFRISLAVLGVALLTCGVAMAQDVKSQAMPGTDFSKYHTYKWVTVEGAKYPNQIMDAEIKQAIDSQLATKGLSKVENDPADLYISYQVAVQQSTQWNAYGTGGFRWGGGMASAQQSTINTGTLVLDFYDPATKTLVWTGSATKTLNPSSNQEKNQKNLNSAMAKLLKAYPPK
jgi:cytochrome c biogenesis factor